LAPRPRSQYFSVLPRPTRPTIRKHTPGVQMTQLAKLVSIATAVPPYILEQQDAASAAHTAFAERFKDFERLAKVFKSSGVHQRYGVRPMDWYLQPLGWPERTRAYLDGLVGCSSTRRPGPSMPPATRPLMSIRSLQSRRLASLPLVSRRARQLAWGFGPMSSECRLRPWLRRRGFRSCDRVPSCGRAPGEPCVASRSRDLHAGL
jgi:hypothetical protein